MRRYAKVEGLMPFLSYRRIAYVVWVRDRKNTTIYPK
nr:MAG TPA: hypothetical protein [Caudoviricetes sp.]